MSIYLDYNASTPIEERVLDLMIRGYREYFGNADSRTHLHGQNASSEVENARHQVASLLGVSNNEIVFTSGATESNNLAILGLEEYGLDVNKRHVITTSIEHKAILESAKHLEKKGFDVELINPNSDGLINPSHLISRIRPDTLLVSVQHVNNETGIIQPVKEIGDTLWETDVLFHIDAVQSCGKLVEEIKLLKYNLMSISSHKMRGPQGIGALILRSKDSKKVPIRPIIFGGGHEGGFRAGTLPVALIMGFGKACEIAQNEYKENQVLYRHNKQRIMESILASDISYSINGDRSYCMDNTLNVSFLGIDSEALMIATKQYCSISNGSACTSKDYSHSHVLVAMGLDQQRIESAIRLSWGSVLIEPDLIEPFFSFVQQQQ